MHVSKNKRTLSIVCNHKITDTITMITVMFSIQRVILHSSKEKNSSSEGPYRPYFFEKPLTNTSERKNIGTT